MPLPVEDLQWMADTMPVATTMFDVAGAGTGRPARNPVSAEGTAAEADEPLDRRRLALRVGVLAAGAAMAVVTALMD